MGGYYQPHDQHGRDDERRRIEDERGIRANEGDQATGDRRGDDLYEAPSRPRDRVRGEATPSASPSASPRASPANVAEAVVGFTIDLRFDPDVLTIATGTAVTWTNNSPMPHTATGDPEQNPVAASHPEYITLPEGAAPWGSDMLQPGDSYTYVFDVPGEYSYICIPHVMSGMRGTIMVDG